MTYAGYVLAGGRSSRMGCDKALLPYRGGALAQTVAAAVAESAGCATLVGHGERYGALGYPVIPDLYPGEGPLGGILTALRHSTAAWNLIVACDMPGLQPDLLRQLLETAAQSHADVLLPFDPEGRPQPLCAVYNRSSLDALTAEFDGGVRKLKTALETVRVQRLAIAQVSNFQNVNTPAEWADYAAN